MTRRAFNRAEHSALYLAADGRCALCGEPLAPGWHADHVQPYIKGGATDVINGQALCAKCNQQKGTKAPMQLRPFQELFVKRVIAKAEAGGRVFVGNITPGGGKTFAGLASADMLMRRGAIDTVVVLAPRLNLARQYEFDWQGFRKEPPWPLTMRGLYHRDNKPPLLRADADGYITTYDSLMRQPDLHLDVFARRRVLLICDEAQQLGIDDEGNATQSAKVVEQLGAAARMIFVLSGTPFRADGSKLLFAEYDNPDDNNFRRLKADIELQYLEGARQGFLRPFEFHLHEGEISYTEFASGQKTRMSSVDMTRGIGVFVCRDDYWKPLVDKVVVKVKEHKANIHPDMRGLIAAFNQEYAKKIVAYLKQRHPDMRVVLAVSDDGAEACERLEQFKLPDNADILVNVKMAYVGYDCKAISVVGILSDIRAEGYLQQLIGRGLRMSSTIPVEKQICIGIVPDDPQIIKFVEALRSESERGVTEREKTKRPGGDGPGKQEPLGYYHNEQMVGVRAAGLDPTGDVDDPNELLRIEQLRKKHQMADSATKLKAMFKDMHTDWTTPGASGGTKETEPVSTQTMKDREADERNRLADKVKVCEQRNFGTRHPDGNVTYTWRETWGALAYIYRQAIEGADLNGIAHRIKTVERWIIRGYDGRKFDE